MNQLPDIHFGAIDAPLPEFDELTDNSADDDEELAETPSDVVALLGFDPLEVDLQEAGIKGMKWGVRHTFDKALHGKPAPMAVQEGISFLRRMKIDPRLLENRQLQSLAVDKSFGAKGLAGFYKERDQSIALADERSVNSFTHEFAHHLDFQFLQRWSSFGEPNDGIRMDKEAVAHGRNGMLEEFREGRATALKVLGQTEKEFKTDAPPSGGVALAKVPTFYAVTNPREWFAEAFMRYANPAHHDALEKLCPKTFDYIDSFVHGKFFKEGA